METTHDREHHDKIELLNTKVDRLLMAVEGDGDAVPGMALRLTLVERVLFGKDGGEGLMTKVTILWRIHLWVLCSLSAGLGFLIREAVRLIWKV